MSRIKIAFPETFSFIATIPVRITDLNYGNHVGNDAVLSIIHEARVQFLSHNGYAELNCGGVGLIMSDVGIEFKKEIFYGDVLAVQIAAINFSSVGFDLFYRILNKENVVVALAKTGMICYNYEVKKIAAVPAEVKAKLSGE
ncbi:acyl-CoA thioesterase FadM [Lacibacter cauensis]|uniref:Acyl-CoA thioesterase FadM n=1 Tax=Lacibacter cauensis TaxID=510947 RepID=A0A562SUD6_9BACT|nr:thioesterase family protein [Lacibacter cauensis]TWI84892.1 acyl-CoA thioesterase FadM [Lacibacter cauensis]